MLVSTITKKGQITLPKKVRDALAVGPSDKILFVRRGDDYIIKPVKDFTQMRGALPVKEAIDFDALREKVKRNVGERVAHE